MTINCKIKSLITAALLVNFSGFAEEIYAKSVAEINEQAPEVTAAETSLSFWKLPYLKKAFIDTTPTDRKDGLAVGDLVANGGNKTMILKLAHEMADQKYGQYDSLLIARHGKLIFESYYLRGRINLPHMQSSVTKSHTSLLVGRAMQLGYLTMADLDKPLASFLKDLDPTKFTRGIEKITLHQAMTMSSGLRFSDEQIKEFRTNASKFKGIYQIQAFFELSAPITTKYQSYLYQSPDPIMVMQVLDAVVPGSAKDFIKNELLNKIGTTVYSWRNDLSGLPQADERSTITSRDMLKLGTLVANKGQWHGEQFISAKFLANATGKLTKATEDWQPNNYNYGYFWYQTDIKAGDKSYDAKIAWGGGGQHIIGIEEIGLVVVITGHDWDDVIMKQVSKAILPAFIN